MWSFLTKIYDSSPCFYTMPGQKKLIIFLKKVIILIIWVYMQCFFIHMMLFIDNFKSKKGYNKDFKIIYFHGAFYDYKF